MRTDDEINKLVDEHVMGRPVWHQFEPQKEHKESCDICGGHYLRSEHNGVYKENHTDYCNSFEAMGELIKTLHKDGSIRMHRCRDGGNVDGFFGGYWRVMVFIIDKEYTAISESLPKAVALAALKAKNIDV